MLLGENRPSADLSYAPASPSDAGGITRDTHKLTMRALAERIAVDDAELLHRLSQ